MTVRKNNRDKWMIDIKFEHPNGHKTRVRKTATVQSKRGAESQELQIRMALANGTYREDAEPESEPDAVSAFAATLAAGASGSADSTESGETARPFDAAKEAKAATEFLLTVAGYAKAFVAARRLTIEKASSVESKESHLREHLVPLWGARRLDRFEQLDWMTLRKYLLDKQQRRRVARAKKRQAKGLPPEDRKPSNGISTFNNVASTLNSMIADAMELGRIARESYQFTLLARQDEPVEFYDFEQFEELVYAAREHSALAEVIVLLGGEAGLRRCEMYPLLWTSCNLPRRQLTIFQAEVTVKFEDEAPQRALDRPKGGVSRVVRMTDRVVAALERLREAQGRRGGRVVLRPDGSMFTDHPFRDFLLEVQHRAGLPATGNVHILRHTFCSHLALRGAPLKSIQALAGHGDIKTTMRYIHLMPNEADRAVDLLNDRTPMLGEGWAPQRLRPGASGPTATAAE